MERRTTLSIAVMAAAASSLGYGTWALFSDVGTSTGNVFEGGELALALDGARDVVGTIGADGFYPGEETALECIALTHAGASSGVDVDVAFATDVTDDLGNAEDALDGGPSAAGMDTFLVLTALTYGGDDLLAGIGDVDGDGRTDTLADAALSPIADLDAPGAAPGTAFCLQVAFDTDGGNDLKRDAVDVTITFSLAQEDAPDLGGAS